LSHKIGTETRWRWLDVSGSLLKRAEEPVDNILLVSRDITESKETEARLEHMALNDPLTDLGNREWFGRIKRGFAQERFHVFYQPIIDLKTGERYCSEALITISRRAGVWHAPAEFLPAAERFHLMNQLDQELGVDYGQGYYFGAPVPINKTN
jgi:EAL domain-containing protein (putative c-di-GMP-specific phosphodiesterase class I)